MGARAEYFGLKELLAVLSLRLLNCGVGLFRGQIIEAIECGWCSSIADGGNGPEHSDLYAFTRCQRFSQSVRNTEKTC